MCCDVSRLLHDMRPGLGAPPSVENVTCTHLRARVCTTITMPHPAVCIGDPRTGHHVYTIGTPPGTGTEGSDPVPRVRQYLIVDSSPPENSEHLMLYACERMVFADHGRSIYRTHRCGHARQRFCRYRALYTSIYRNRSSQQLE